jgi:peptidoglycan/xylan/chitin deacetylase (PgdA/CDA1 family)
MNSAHNPGRRIIRTMLVSMIILICGTRLNAQRGFSWPGEAVAAVCLTYDDGLDCHLDVAAPALERHGFRGTFYVTGNSSSLYQRTEAWRAMAARGHELGNHTLFHPCWGDAYDWVRPEYDLNGYTFPQLMAELQVANSLLKAVDGEEERSFAYTCTNAAIGGVSFVDSIKSMFTAARGGGPIPERIDEVDIYNVPSWGVEDPTGEELIAYVEEAVEKGTVAVFMFHSVGGGYLNVSEEAHEQLLEYLEQHRATIWTAPFKEVMKVVSGSLPEGSGD